MFSEDSPGVPSPKPKSVRTIKAIEYTFIPLSVAPGGVYEGGLFAEQETPGMRYMCKTVPCAVFSL